jgi:geranylgeranyl pyrophosphate synthase
MTLKDQLDAWRLRVDAALLQQLPEQDSNGTQLQAAMRYAATIGGKRVRPVLTYATGEALGVDPARLDVPAMAVEMMHAYSLVHDDLPAMDDDDLRRGNPTCHIRFGEATAILAGDALQALAFTLLATNKDPTLSDTARVRMIAVLGEASGGLGMAAGQAIDLEAVGKSLDLAALENMHRHKTGALIRASVVMGAMTAGAEPDLIKRLDSYAAAVGLSFQIVDDILDVVSDTETLGKTQGADIALNKPTYPALLGLDGARRHAQATHAEAVANLDGLGKEFDTLRRLSAWVVERSH